MPVIAFDDDESNSRSVDQLARAPSLGRWRKPQIRIIAETMRSVRFRPAGADIEQPAGHQAHIVVGETLTWEGGRIRIGKVHKTRIHCARAVVIVRVSRRLTYKDIIGSGSQRDQTVDLYSY